MHLGIVELYAKNHHSLIHNWIKVAKLNNWNITLYIREKLYEDISGEFTDLDFRIVICSGGILKILKHIINDYGDYQVDQLLFLSLTGYIYPFTLIDFSGINYGITVHNANAWFVKNTIRKPRHLLKRFIRHRLRKYADYFVVNSKNMKMYIEENANEKRPILVMPFSLKKSASPSFDNEVDKNLTVVYPGSVNIQRKLYDKFFKLAVDNPHDKFILLGKAELRDKRNKKIFNKAKEISNILVFKDYIPIKKFNDYLRQADILFSEINLNYQISDMSETYGLTKDSGVSYLMAEFLLPALLNKSFENIPMLKRASIGFEDYNDLNKKFLSLHDSANIVSLQKKMILDLNSFTIEEYAKKMMILEDI